MTSTINPIINTAANEAYGTTGLDVRNAICSMKGFDPEMWFPAPSNQVSEHNAKFVCGVCPLARDCADQARVNRYDGVWGGVLFRNGREVNR